MLFRSPHCGSAVPLLQARIGGMWHWNPESKRLIPKGVPHELKKLYYDVALSARPECLAPLMRLVTPKNVVFGTDFPWGGMGILDTVQGLVDFGFTDEELKLIEHENARALFPGLAR